MPEVKFAIQYSIDNKENQGVPVVIVAAGSSSRMGGIDKMFAPLCGIPTIARTMLAFQRNADTREIIVVTKEESIADIKKLADAYMITKLTCVVKGGDDRLSSVKSGIDCISDSKGVMIHDGARPFVSDALISKMAQASLEYDCAVCAIRVKDTIKQVNENSVKTCERDKLYAVQTPQSVNLEIYKQLLSECKDKSCYTDDASVFEQAGYNTNIIDGEESNIKITTPYDLKLAEFILKEGKVCE